MTPHINAKKGEIAKVVLLAGDPLRAKYVAENFLQDYKLVSSVRNMFFYTGNYKGAEITVAGSGMGNPSIGIYSYELFKFYDVDLIMRFGSTGSYVSDLNIFDLVLVKEAYSESAYAKLLLNQDQNVMKPSSDINNLVLDIAKQLKIKIREERTHSSDVFYDPRTVSQRINDTQASCVEMESFALFANAIALKKQAATILTVSDNLVSKEELNAENREKAFKDMMKLVLEVSYENYRLNSEKNR